MNSVHKLTLTITRTDTCYIVSAQEAIIIAQGPTLHETLQMFAADCRGYAEEFGDPFVPLEEGNA